MERIKIPWSQRELGAIRDFGSRNQMKVKFAGLTKKCSEEQEYITPYFYLVTHSWP